MIGYFSRRSLKSNYQSFRRRKDERKAHTRDSNWVSPAYKYKH